MDWPRVAQYLATQFIDYEPGIHFSQIQMQSGTTGINTLRVYNLQAGARSRSACTFIKKWPQKYKTVLKN